jgi:hypothetical protein
VIAALFVETDGPYFGMEGIDPWDLGKDARSYRGPHPVIAHPPCERWGNYAEGGPNPAAERRTVGDDGGCFDRALWAVRNFGGVLEHPANSKAFRYYRICSPDPLGGWHSAGDGFGAWVCQVHQGHYGHPADKATWLYARAPRDTLPELTWGPCVGKIRLEEGFHSSEARSLCGNHANQEAQREGADTHAKTISRSARSNRRAKEFGLTACEWLSHKQRRITPEKFRDVLISLARGCA